MKNTSYATTVEIDLGNKSHWVCAVDAEGKIQHKLTIDNNLGDS